MSEMYLGTDVLEMAVKMEKLGHRFYTKSRDRFRNPDVRQAFDYLAKEEEKHVESFEEMLEEAKRNSKHNPFIEPVRPEYMDELISGRVFPEDLGQDADSLDLKQSMQLALTLEKDTILFYHEMLAVTSHHDIGMVKQILNEERDHILKILELKRAIKV